MRACLIFGVLVAATATFWGQMVVLPYQSTLTLPEGRYGVQMCEGKCTGLQGVEGKDGKMVAQLTMVDGSMSCPSPNGVGIIRISSAASIAIQRKVLIHEVVHAALTCDQRQETIEERIAEDVSALYDDQNFHAFMTR